MHTRIPNGRSGGPISAIVAAVSAVAALIGLSTTATGAPPAPDGGRSSATVADFNAIDRFVQTEMSAIGLPGLALGITHGDRVVHLRGFGIADLSGRPVTPQTPFVPGSVTKSFTALAVMQLVEADLLDLDAPVQRYLPWFRVADPEASKQITLRHLLHHVSGLPEQADYPAFAHPDHSADALEQAVRNLRTAELSQPVGAGYQYSNSGYAILGLIVQTIAGQPYPEYIDQHIFEPLDMRNSYASLEQARQHGVATGHRFLLGRPQPASVDSYAPALTPAGYISASAEDLAHYLIAHLNDGRYDDTTVVSPVGMGQLHTPAVTVAPSESYAMGWMVRHTNGIANIAHGGETFSEHAMLIQIPAGEWGIALVTNALPTLHIEQLNRISTAVMSLITNQPLPPQAPEPEKKVLLVTLAVLALQGIGLARSVVLVRRWRTQPARHPRPVIGAIRILLPLLANLALLWAILNQAAGLTTDSVLLIMQFGGDIGWALLISATIAAGWGVILRPTLTILTLRSRPPETSDNQQPARALAETAAARLHDGSPLRMKGR
jgi:CubicO group peptidase (beta-lactamase class C family)